MPHSRLERRLVAGILVLFAIPAAAVGGALALLHRRGAFADVASLGVAVIAGFVAVMVYLGIVSWSIGRSLARSLVELEHGTELMASVHPDHRHRIRTGDELEAVAEEINRMADGLRDARLGLATEVARATQELSDERAKLAGILAEMDAGVVVARSDGLVTLANRAARDLLGDDLLGRSLYEVVDRESVTQVRDQLQTGQGTVERFTLHRPAGIMLEAGMTSFTGVDGAVGDFILALRDVSRPLREHEAEARRLDVSREVRGSVSSIRWIAETLLGDPAVAGTGAAPLVSAIHAEAARLSGLIAGLAGIEEPPEAPLVPTDPAPAVPRLVGAGLRSGTRGAAPERPRLYDFSALDPVEPHVSAPDRARALRDFTYVALDVETTGVRPEAGDRIVSLAGVRIRNGLVNRGDCFDALVNPGRPVPAASARVHGITDEMLAGVPSIDVVLRAFERFAGAAALVGHDVWFDLAFLVHDAEHARLASPTPLHPVLDTRALSELVHGPAGEHTLDTVAARLGVTIQGRHSALGDALATAEIFVRLLQLLDRRGIRTLGQALDASRVVRRRWPRDHTGLPS